MAGARARCPSTISVTAPTISAAASTVIPAMRSPRMAHPRRTAITGFTYAYVDVSDVVAFFRSQT